MKRIFTADNITEAGLVRSYLEQFDISSQLRNEFTSSVMGELPFVNSWPEVWVAANDEARAKELINELQSQQGNEVDWVCSSCREENPGSFHSCWQCGRDMVVTS